MNIEEIKKKVDEAVPSLENAPELRYLLSIIEQAEKLLEQFANRDNWKVNDSTYTVEYVGEDEPWTISQSALQAIRK